MTTSLVTVPEALLVPLLDTAAALLAELEPDEAPVPLRRLLGWDRRGLARSAARTQIRRAIEDDAAFADRVRVRLLERPDVQALAASLEDERLVEDGLSGLIDRGDLPLLISYLVAARPPGSGLGVAAAVALYEQGQERAVDEAAHTTAVARVAELEEARRRDRAAAIKQSAELTRLDAELREERQSRRAREVRAAADVASAQERLAEVTAELAAWKGAAESERQHAGREATRARVAEDALRGAWTTEAGLRADLAQALAGAAGRRPLGRREHDTLVQAAAAAEELARRLGEVVREAVPNSSSDVFEPAGASAAPRARPARVAADTVAAGGRGGPGPRPGRDGRRRAPVPVPPGMLSDTPAAIEGAMRAGRVAVVIDGYNLAMREWPGEPPLEQRERLIALATNLRARMRTPVTVVFDGSDVAGVPTPRRAGVRVLFSTAGETADDVVVREVAATPPEIPVIAVSSDRDLCRRVAAEGALAVPVDAFADVLRG